LDDEDGGTVIACRILINELLGKSTSTLKRLHVDILCFVDRAAPYNSVK
jgi:hypothetical protein